MAFEFDFIIDAYINDIHQQVRHDFEKTVEHINNELYAEARDMYDAFIEQFYTYKTTRYVRHGQTKPGTQTGENLYRGNGIAKTTKGGLPAIRIDFTPGDMAGGYLYNSPAQVLDSVMHGYRFMEGMPWSGDYQGVYFSYSGTPADAFEEFQKKWDEISGNLFMEIWAELGW